MQFRMISFKYFDAYTNMALDEAIMNGVRAGTTLPTIRFYGWEPTAVSIGYFQGIKNEVNLDAAKKAGVDVVRRLTGGGAVFHDMLGEVTYSIIGPQNIFPGDVIESYRFVCQDILYGLEILGIKASFEPINDIMFENKKISGNAQTRRGGILLQHGTILYKVDVDKMFSILNVSKQKSVDKLIKSVKKRVTGVSDMSNVSMEELAAMLEKGFSRNREIIRGDYTDEELKGAEHIVKEKFKTEAWNFRL